MHVIGIRHCEEDRVRRSNPANILQLLDSNNFCKPVSFLLLPPPFFLILNQKVGSLMQKKRNRRKKRKLATKNHNVRCYARNSSKSKQDLLMTNKKRFPNLPLALTGGSGVSPDYSFYSIAFSLSLVRFFLFTRNKEKETNVTKIVRIQQLRDPETSSG